MLRSGLLTSGPNETYEMRQGAPDTFPKDLLPDGAIPELSSISSSFTVVVATINAGKPFDRIRFEWKLEDAGWISKTTSARGFSGAQESGEVRFCRGGDLATFQFRTVLNGDRLVRVSLGKEPERFCPPVSGRQSFSDVPVPVLMLPPGVRSTGMGGRTAVDDTSSYSRFATTMTVDALASHFVPQFKDAGWKVESGPTSDGVMSVTRFSGVSRAGDPVTGQLVITAVTGTPYVDAMARFVRHKPVRTP